MSGSQNAGGQQHGGMEPPTLSPLMAVMSGENGRLSLRPWMAWPPDLQGVFEDQVTVKTCDRGMDRDEAEIVTYLAIVRALEGRR